jgi:hypothetical protein
MKTLTKSVTMKEIIKSTPYFQGYSLKALNISSSQPSDDKRNSRISKVLNGLNVLPASGSEKKISINKITIPVTVQSADNNWFNNYE